DVLEKVLTEVDDHFREYRPLEAETVARGSNRLDMRIVDVDLCVLRLRREPIAVLLKERRMECRRVGEDSRNPSHDGEHASAGTTEDALIDVGVRRRRERLDGDRPAAPRALEQVEQTQFHRRSMPLSRRRRSAHAAAIARAPIAVRAMRTSTAIHA